MPRCCGQEMALEDDHNRYRCFVCFGGFDGESGSYTSPPPKIPQVDTSKMSDSEKAKIPTINRLNDTPTSAEADVFKLLLNRGMDTPEYQEALRALNKERAG